MRIGSVSTYVMNNAQRRAISQQQKDMLNAGYEADNGRVSDIGLTLGRITGRFLDAQSRITLLQGYKDTNALVGERMKSAQAAISSLVYAPRPEDKGQPGALTKYNQMLLGGGSASSTGEQLATAAQAALDAFVSALNTNVGDEFVFGGINTTEPPLKYYKAGSDAEGSPSKIVRDAFSKYLTDNKLTADKLTKEDMKKFIDGDFSKLFEDPSWHNFSNAADGAQKSCISPDGETVDVSVSANEDGFRQAMKSLVLMAEFGGRKDISDDAKAAVTAAASTSPAKDAGGPDTSIGGAIQKINEVSSRLGSMQNRVQWAVDRSESQVTILKNMQNDLIGVDQTEATSRFSQLQLMIQVSYKLTAQIASLSLVNYL